MTNDTPLGRVLRRAKGGAAAPPSDVPGDAPDNPHRLAGEFLAGLGAGPPLIRFWRGEFHRYAGGAYRAVPDEDLRAELVEWVRAEFLRQHAADLAAWREAGSRGTPPRVRSVTVGLIGNVLQAIRGRCLLPAGVDAPAWVNGATGPDPAGLLAVRNGLLDLAAAAGGRPGCLLPASPSFFTTSAAPFDFDRGAPTPAGWLEFLRELWPDDRQSVDAIQEWCGYLLTPDTRQQKILFLIGPKRSGKGTIARMVRELVGPSNVAGPTLGSLATNFGLAPLLGKSVAVVSDARLSSRSDAAVIVERLLSISGEDALTIDRKHREPLTVRLNTRLMILSNELPKLGDASGALAGRLLLLRLTRSWYGREDHRLFDRLRGELPGVLLWAIEGWRRLQARGRFVLPDSARELVADMEDLASPVGSFVRERCWVEPGCEVTVSDLYGAWRDWCVAHGKKEPGTEESFGRDLRAVLPELRRTRPRTEFGRVYSYSGIRKRLASDPADGPGGGPSGPSGPSSYPLHTREEDEESSPIAGAMAGRWDHPDHQDQAEQEAITRYGGG